MLKIKQLIIQNYNKARLRYKFVQIVSLFLFLLVLWFVFWNWNDISAVYRTISIWWALTGFGCYVVNYIFRGFRLKIMAGPSMESWQKAFHFSALHGCFSYLLPFRTGDASLPVLLKATGKINFKTGVGILVKSRFMDFSMLGIFSVLGSFFITGKISTTVQAFWMISGFFLILSWYIFKKFGSISAYLLQKKFKYELDVSVIFKFEWMEFFVTFLIWTCIYASQYCMIRSIGIDLRLPEIIFLSAIQLPLQLLPVQGLANSGNHEGGWVAALVLIGFNTQEALKFALASHGVLIGYVALLGLVAVFMGYYKRGEIA